MLGIIRHHFKWMKVNVAVGAILGAESAADAPIFDYNLKRIAAANRAHRAADHAERILALAARRGDKIIFETQPLADQASDAIVSIGVGAHARVATRATLQIEQQKALRFHQPLGQKTVERLALRKRQAFAVLLQVRLFDAFQLLANFGEFTDHPLKIVNGDAHKLDVIESRTSGRANI